jgi:hypothetical protein
MPVDDNRDGVLEATASEYAPFDPQEVGAQSLAPEASSFAPPPADVEAQRSPAADDGEAEDEELPEFDPRCREDFVGLNYLGALTKTFSRYGHDFLIRTLTVDEVIEVGILHKPYVGTLGEIKAYQAAITAACIVTVDGKTPPLPITDESTDTILRNRFHYVRNHWFPPVLDAVYEEYLLLEEVVDRVLESMGKASG